MADEMLASELVRSWLSVLDGQRKLAEGAIAQVDEERMHRALAPGTNSIAVIVQHLSGNMVSRFTGFMEEDGEKPWRGRDGEFVDRGLSKAELMERWARAWDLVGAQIGALRAEDLERTVTIRGEPHSVPKAVARHIAHASYHVGQIMMIARGLVGTEGWNWQTVPPGASEAYTREVRGRQRGG